MESLNVYLHQRLAGLLSQEKGQLSFQYDPAYLKSSDAQAVSHSMPLVEKSFDHQTTSVFFENLLPPDDVRKRLGKILHISRHNIFAFLKAIGGDCAGAIALYPPDSAPDTTDTECLHALSDDAAAGILLNLPRRPLNLGALEGFRISGSGAQDKLIARVLDGKIFLPLYGTPSTHIIKPGMAAYPESVFNEFFCMKLAQSLRLSTANCSILNISGKAYYCTERYDRYWLNGKVYRLHQEDFCQLFAVDPENKYENEGGPGLAKCFAMIRKLRLGAAGQLEFIRRVIFNYLIGNGDAHAKNFAVLYHGRKAELAPLYDLLSTAVYPSLAREFAMSIGGNLAFDKVTRKSFVRLAQDCAIRPQLLLDELDKLSETVPVQARQLAEETNASFPANIYGKIIDGIDTRAKLR